MERPQNKHLKRGPGPGRPAGSLNKATREIKELARAIVEDPSYRKKLRRRMIEGKAGPIEPLLWYYAYGKPKEVFQHSGDDDGPIAVSVMFYGDKAGIQGKAPGEIFNPRAK